MKTSNEFLIGVYKEVGKNPDLLKVLNTKESLEKLVGGEIATFDYDNYVVIYRKDCKNLLPNVYADKFSKLGTTLRGTLFTVNKDNENKFKSITKEQAFKITEFFIRESFNYKNFEKKGRYIPRSKRNKKIFGNKNNENFEQNKTSISKQEEKNSPLFPNINNMTQTLNIDNNFFESQLRLEKVKANNKAINTSTSNENTKLDTNQQSTTNESTSSVIKLSDEETLNMILKIVFIILDFVKSTMEDSSNE